jgi:hypothetical protein
MVEPARFKNGIEEIAAVKPDDPISDHVLHTRPKPSASASAFYSMKRLLLSNF